MHGERQIGLRLRRKHASWGKSRIVDQCGVVVALPLGGVGRVGYNHLERFVVPVLWIDQRVAVGNVEMVVVHIVQEHVDAAQVVRGQVLLLAEKPLPDLILAQHFDGLQQQGTGTARWVVDLVHFALAMGGDPGQQLADFLWREELATGLAGVRRVHGHQILICVTERINFVVREALRAQVQIANGVEHLHQLGVAIHHGVSELAAVQVQIVEQAAQAGFRTRADGRALDVLEHSLQRLVQVLVSVGTSAHVGEQIGRENEIALFFHHRLTHLLGGGIVQLGVVEIHIVCLVLVLVQV